MQLQATARGKSLLGIPLGRMLRTDGQVADDEVGVGALKNACHICDWRFAFLDNLREILSQAIQCRPAMHHDAVANLIDEAEGIIRFRADGFA
jgi:hypothetical protein